jgi:hypothetical protein
VAHSSQRETNSFLDFDIHAEDLARQLTSGVHSRASLQTSLNALRCATSGSELEQRSRGLAVELRSQPGGIPVLPCFGEHSILDTHERGPSDFYRLPRGCLAKLRRPVHADEIAFSEGSDWAETEVGEVGAQAVIKTAEFVRPRQFRSPIVQVAAFGKEFKDGFSAALIPHFIKLAKDQLLVLIRSRERLRCGKHGVTSNGNMLAKYIEIRPSDSCSFPRPQASSRVKKA